MVCQSCGEEVSSKVRFCPVCGIEIEEKKNTGCFDSKGEKIVEVKKKKKTDKVSEGKFIFYESVDKILESLGNNQVFLDTYPDEDTWKEIVTAKPFEKIYSDILQEEAMSKSIMAQDIVYCMYPEYNRFKEDISKIYSMFGFQDTADEKGVLFVDSSILTNRKKGILITTKGIYSSKEMRVKRESDGQYYGTHVFSFTLQMKVHVDNLSKKLFFINTEVLSYGGLWGIFESVVAMINLIYIFNCIRSGNGIEEKSAEVQNVEDFLSRTCNSVKIDSIYCEVGQPVISVFSKKYGKAQFYFEIPEEDSVFLILDATAFGSCKKGFAICTSGIYCCTGKGGEYISWLDFKDCPLGTKGGRIVIGNKEFSTGGNEDKFLKILITIQEIFQKAIN